MRMGNRFARRVIARAGCMAWVVLAVGALAATVCAEASKETLPNIYGGGLPMAFSGLDGRTSWAAPVTAETVAGEVALRMHLPKDPVIRIVVASKGLEEVKWRLVSNDLLVGYVPWDAVPLVVGFMSSNVVVGRLPMSCRVTLDGGDGRSALHRSEAGDRTKFAFAYDSRGAKVAATTATQAVNVSIDTLVESRTDFFQKLPPLSINTERIRARAFEKAFSVLRMNVYSPEDPITVRWTTPDRWPERDMGLWQSAFHSLGLMHMDPRLAQESLEAVYGFQTESGMIPGRGAPGQPSEVSQPPVLAWAAWQLYGREKIPNRKFLQRSFDVTQKHVLWFMKERRLGGPPPADKPVEFGVPLYAWKSAEESGMENAPRFEGAAGAAAVDLSCYLAEECRTLQAMAQSLGYRELAKTWGQRGDAVAEAARKQLWNAERGFFFDRKGADGEWVEVWSATGLLPLWAGIATPEQAARLKEHLVSKKFWTAEGVPSVARDDPRFKKDMWCGNTWMNLNYLLVRGLQQNGFEKEAADLREKTLATVTRWYAGTGALSESYDCDGQTPPMQLARKGQGGAGAAAAADGQGGSPSGLADYNWTAAVFVDLMLRPKP